MNSLQMKHDISELEEEVARQLSQMSHYTLNTYNGFVERAPDEYALKR